VAKAPWELWQDAADYAGDAIQRLVLFWDTLRQRGNNHIEHERAGKPPLLAYKHEMLADGRKFERPVNYALLRIVPPWGVSVDETLRRFIIVDPRAGHGPGVGGFKADPEVGVALRAGHPVYFVIFFPEPEPAQTMADVVDAQVEFVRIVAERHPASAKPGPDRQLPRRLGGHAARRDPARHCRRHRHQWRADVVLGWQRR